MAWKNEGSSQLWSLRAPVLSKLTSRRIHCTSPSLRFLSSVSRECIVHNVLASPTRFPIKFLLSCANTDSRLIYPFHVNAIYGFVSFPKYISFHHFQEEKTPVGVVVRRSSSKLDPGVTNRSSVRHSSFLYASTLSTIRQCVLIIPLIVSSHAPFRLQWGLTTTTHSFQCLFSLLMSPYMQHYSMNAGT